MKPFAIVILAAGKGTRMKSDLPKVLHPLLGRPMLDYVLETARQLKAQKTLVVVGHQAERVQETFKNHKVIFIHQQPQLGTGHAVQMAQGELASSQGQVLVLSGDVPLLQKETLKQLLQLQRRAKASLSLLTTEVEDPKGYGRIVRDLEGRVTKIVEEKEALPQEREIKEINAGIYCFDANFLFRFLPRLSRKNKQKEYYLTDLVHLACRENLQVSAYRYPCSEEVLGINDHRELARSGQILRQQVLDDWMRQGVSILDPSTTYIEKTVRIGSNCVIGPFSVLLGKTRIGTNCVIHSHVVIENSVVKNGLTILPFSRIMNRVMNQA
jgi:bifunctional UDP-N-acetylglucosamine pyrophosphorylase/glucosamine-1-phosphate N-acetyltransferase